jgi:hypothetical protein
LCDSQKIHYIISSAYDDDEEEEDEDKESKAIPATGHGGP